MSFKPHQMLSHYRLLNKVGEGGMGVVYVAWDATLKRKVALKVLPEALATDPARLERFQREAEMVAALNHPCIVTIHSVEESDGTRFLTMELVDGESLDHVVAEGPLPVPRVIDIGIALADALSAAHERGIVHRDLKPANVMLTRDGRVKVLDFGLAKLAEPASGDLSQLATRRTPLTREGGVLGTAPYMAPEQLRGEPVDHRTDLFSLGVVLYELATGRRPFAGKNTAELVSSILRDTPVPVTRIREDLPRHLGRIIVHCLEKGLRERFQTARDVCNELEQLRVEVGPAAQVAPPPGSLSTAGPGPIKVKRPVVARRWILLVGAGLLIAGTAVVWFVRSERRSKPDASAGIPATGDTATGREMVVRGVIELPEDTPLALGVETYIGYHPTLIAVSPDGARVAFVGPARGGSTQLYLRELSALEVRPVADSVGALHPFFSPDGRWLGFLTVDKVKKVPIAGGPSETLCGARVPMRATWARDGWIYVGEIEGSVLSRVSETGGPLNEIMSGDRTSRVFQILPDGGAALLGACDRSFAGDYCHIEVLSLDTLEREPLSVMGYDARVVASGHLLFVRAGSLMVAPFDVARRKVLGESSLAVAGVSTDSMFRWAQYAVSDNGLLVYVPGADRAVGNLVAVDRAARVLKLRAPEGLYGPLDLDGNATRLGVLVGDVNDYAWIFDLRRQEGRKLVMEKPFTRPVWSPDGESVAVRAGGPTAQGIYKVTVADSGAAERLYDEANPDSWSPDGRWLAFSNGAKEPRRGVIQLLGDRKVIPLPIGHLFSFSPDSRFLAYVSYETGSAEIWVRSLAAPPFARQMSTEGGFEPRWVRDGIFYRKGRQWFFARVASLRPVVEWEPPQLAFETDFLDTPGMSYAVSQDGQRLFVVKSAHEPTVSRLAFVQNWFEELKAKVPVRP